MHTTQHSTRPTLILNTANILLLTTITMLLDTTITDYCVCTTKASKECSQHTPKARIRNHVNNHLFVSAAAACAAIATA